MDTSSLPSADAKPLQPVATSRVSTGPSVIQEYKQRVKGMVGLMLRLSHEGASPALEQELELAASSMVSFSACMSLAVKPHHSLLLQSLMTGWLCRQANIANTAAIVDCPGFSAVALLNDRQCSLSF